jgi:hypothetical protein
MIQAIEHCGELFHECSLPGETRADDVFPAHPNGIQVSRDRFLIVYATRGYRGTDDDLSIVGQLRQGAYDGPVVREIMLSKSVNDWEPFNDGMRFVRQHGHPVAFGVPKGAFVGGGPAPHANVFVVKWRLCARYIDPATGLMGECKARPQLGEQTQSVEWVQLRLNEAEDDLEVLQTRCPLRQSGFEDGGRFCEADVKRMNQSFVQAVPFSADATEWADVNHFDGGRIAALRYRFNAGTGLYEWVQTGPLWGGDGTGAGGLFEANLAACRGAWVVSARRAKEGTTAWMRMDDPFRDVPEVCCPAEPANNSPLTAYACPDGVIRLLSGDPKASPYRNGRDPLYLWDVDPDAGFAISNRRVVFDCVKANIGIPQAQVPRVDMAKLLPHAGGRAQCLVHRVRSKATHDARKTGKAISQAEKDASGIYHARLCYTEEFPGLWRFE